MLCPRFPNVYHCVFFHIGIYAGDFEYYKINGKYYDTEAIQTFLVKALRVSMPSVVDSAAIAGVIDLLRTQGSFALSVRYATSFIDNKDVNPMDANIIYPSIWHYEEIGKVFEKALDELIHSQDENIKSLETISSSPKLRDELVQTLSAALIDLASSKELGHGMMTAIDALSKFVSFDMEEGNIGKFVQSAVDAFFDNDLLHSMRLFLERAKGE